MEVKRDKGADWRRRREGVAEGSDPPLEPNTALAECVDINLVVRREATPPSAAVQ